MVLFPGPSLLSIRESNVIVNGFRTSYEFRTFRESICAVYPMKYELFTNIGVAALGSGVLVLVYAREVLF